MVDVMDEERTKVIGHLRGPDKYVSSKYHYDERGSQLFEEITELEEYYLTRTEHAMLEELIPALISELRPATLVELGAGSAEKSRIILSAMIAAREHAVFVPVDVSGDFLRGTAEALRAEYDSLDVYPVVADILDPIALDEALPHPMCLALLGSTLGNFETPHDVGLLRHVSAAMAVDDRFLLGVDLCAGPEKSVDRVEAAYNDSRGITAQFSLNLLSVLNESFGSDFDLDGFHHRSKYNRELSRIETSLVSLREQVVRFPDEDPIFIAEGEAIRSEISAKYDRRTVEHIFSGAGLVVDQWMTDPDELYALVLGRLSDG